MRPAKTTAERSGEPAGARGALASRRRGYPPIDDHGIVGDLHTVALVGMDGAIDFMCLPSFDSPTVFASLLDRRRGGHFSIAPLLDDASHKQLYLPDTNVLLTRFLAPGGVAEISDFMPIKTAGSAHCLVRRAKTVRGEIRYRVVCAPRLGYAREEHRIERRQGEVLFISQRRGGCVLRLRSDARVRVEGGAAIAELNLRAGESAAFVLELAREGEESPSAAPDFVAEAFKETINFWRRWIGRSKYRGRWQASVNRSALALKLLFSEPNGSLVAAPTFGLPEVIGGERNWDYRYTWIRDASFTLDALIGLGYSDEARSFMDWIEARSGELRHGGALQPMYGIDGRHALAAENLTHLEGYMGSSPVQVGNDAYRQLQLDTYGSLLTAIDLYDQSDGPVSHDLWASVLRLIDWVCKSWHRKDRSIWEIRSRPREFFHSRVMCWVAIERALRIALRRSLPAPLERWHAARDQLYREIFRRFWSERRRAFVQRVGNHNVDAASLLVPLVGFTGPRDPRWLATLSAIEQDLVYDSLVYRYRSQDFDDGLSGREGTFSMCSFWYVECLSRSGDAQKARLFFEKALGYANHLGLFAEELGTRGEQLGNFPQAFTHLALISAARNLDEALSATGERDGLTPVVGG